MIGDCIWLAICASISDDATGLQDLHIASYCFRATDPRISGGEFLQKRRKHTKKRVTSRMMSLRKNGN